MKGIAKAVLFFAFLLLFNGCDLAPNKIALVIRNEFVNACRRSDVDKVEVMLKLGVTPNTTDENGFTGLMVASVNGDLPLAKLLVKHGADVNQKYQGNVMVGMKGETALTFLLSSWHLVKDTKEENVKLKRLEQVANFLVDNGIDLNYKNSFGFNYLMIAAKEGMTPLIKKLIEKGMDVNAQSPEGGTALMLASLNGNTDTVKFLLEHGADPNVKVFKGEYKGYTALKFAKEKEYKEIENLLKQYGAKE